MESAARVLREDRGSVAVLTLNRPDVLNAIDAKLSLDLGAAIDACALDGDVRVVVVRGAGRAFCAGHDLRALAAGESTDAAIHPLWGYAGTRHSIDKPVIVAAHGYAFGGGMEIALAADFIIAAPTLQLGLPEVTRGLIASSGGLPRIAQKISPGVAAWLAFSGEPMDAANAARWGLVHDIAPEEHLLKRALGMAERIAANAPLAVRASKRVLRTTTTESTAEDRVWQVLRSEHEALVKSADVAEGAAAFLEHRAPRWTGQ